MANDIIDYGKWEIPTSWDDITLKMFQRIEKYYSEKEKSFDAREVIHILADKSIDEVNMLPVELMEKIMEKTDFLFEAPKERKPTNKIVIDGEEYSINIKEKLKVGEYVAVDTVLKNDKSNYAAFLAILCRKPNEVYDSHFESEVLQSRIEMFEKQPITKILPIIAFFFELYMKSTAPTLLSSQIMDAINHMRNSIENSHRNGEVSKRSMKSAMRKLKKLEKSISSI